MRWSCARLAGILGVSALLSVAFFSLPASAQTVGADAALIPVAATSPQALTGDIAPLANRLSIVIGGDLGFGGSGQPPSAAGAPRHGIHIPFDALTAGLKPLLDGDVVFANLETVVSDRPNLTAMDKTFTFRSHPSALRHLVALGLNAVSTANNHAVDYGDAGLNETLLHLQTLRGEGGLQAFPGIGLGRRAALAPHAVRTNGLSVNIAAIGIGAGSMGQREGNTRPAMASYGAPTDLTEATAALAAAGGDVRLLSVHYGIEMQVRPSSTDEQRLRAAAIAADAHIVAGHHAHVAAGVQRVDGRFLFYGLGNLLHPGMQDMGRYGVCRDYGLLARVHLNRQLKPSEVVVSQPALSQAYLSEAARPEPGRFEVRAIEVVTLADMHSAARARSGEDGRTRIAVLNHLAAGLDRPASERPASEGPASEGPASEGPGEAIGVRFTPREDGTGLWCAPGAENDAGAIGAMCRQRHAPMASSPDLAHRIASSCGTEPVARLDARFARNGGSAAPIIAVRASDQSQSWRDVVLQTGR